MRKTHWAIAAVAMAALMTVSLSAFGQGSRHDEVQQLASRWVEAYNRHDRAALGALYAPDAKLMMHGAPTYSGREDIEAFWAEDFQAGSPLTVLTITHAVEGSDMILVHGNYQVIDRETGGQVSFGRFAHIWTRDAGGPWLIDRDLWNTSFDPYRP